MPDLDTVDDQQLQDAGFTAPASEQFRRAVGDYSVELLKRTTLAADADKLDNEGREVTGVHVRHAARDIAVKPQAKPLSFWAVSGHVAEYLLTAAAGVGAGHLDKQQGIVTFGACLAVATVLLVTRLARGRN